MKTKEFIQKVKGKKLPTKISTNGDKIYIYPNINTLAALGWVSKSRNEFHIFENCPIDLAELVFKYGMTPLEEREEEKKYLYKFPFHATGMHEKCGGYVLRIPPDELAIDESPLDFVMEDTQYHFTDKQVDQYGGRQRMLFDTCLKIEVK